MSHSKPTTTSVGRLAWLLGAVGALFLTTNATAQVTSDMVWWARHELAVPYTWSGSRRDASEVVLYYSADQGRSWKRAGLALPHVRSFRFKAPSDGEYWFAIRTYDSGGRATPPGPLGPEMRVTIDTAKPKIDSLNATLSNQTLTVDLSVSDPGSIADEAIQVYAQAAGQPGWMPVTMQRSLPGRYTGEWRVGGAATVSVRVAVADRAGNRAEQATLATPRTTDALVSSRSTSFGTLDPFAAAEADSVSASTSQRRQPSRRDTLASAPWPSESQRSRPLLSPDNGDGWSSNRRARPFSSASFRGLTDDPMAGPASILPSRLVNSTDFEFDYELEETGRWGVAKVELWGTENGGRSWRRFAIDSDRQSPIHVTVPGEGEYGFRLVVESIGGLDAITPRPGDTPEAIVGVDLESPRVSLTDFRQGDGYFADQLVIKWRADDANLAERPIDLFYSNRASGPWVPIATNLADSGRHSWRLQRHLPRSVYLKIEARDDAGNKSVAVSPTAIEIAVPTASGSLQGVRAAR